MASGGCSHPPVARFFVKNLDKLYAYDFLAMLLKFYWLTSQGCSFARELSRDFFLTWGKRKIAIFEVLKHMSESFQYFFMKSS